MSENNCNIVCFGEVLWDILPSGPRPGGAPMNVAYHLRKQGENVTLITKIGNDDKGKELRSVFSERGLCTDFFQVDQQYETGKVFAQPNEQNEVMYDIVYPAAWDFIELDERGKKLVSQSRYFVYGSLAVRNKESKDTLYGLLELANTRVLDINLRAPHYDKSTLSYLLYKAHTAKMNIAELELIASWYGSPETTIDRMQLIQDEFNIDTVIVTMGSDGAIVNDKGSIYRHPGFKVKVSDTIGCGDGFLAGFLHCLLKGSSLPEALSFASAVGAFIATRTGACPIYETNDIANLINSYNYQRV